MCMCASAGSAHHRRAPYTVTMMTSKTRHLSLNRPDTHIHNTHQYRMIRQAGRHKQDMSISRHTHTQHKQDAASEHRYKQTDMITSRQTKHKREESDTIAVLTDKHLL